MKKNAILLLIVFSLFFACQKENNIKDLFRQAENMENDILKSINDIALCKTSYEKIIVKAPDSEFAPIACYKLGKLNEIFGHYEEALDYYQQVVSIYPESPIADDVLFNMTQIYQLHTDKWEQAISAYSQFASLFPKHQQAQNAQLNIAEIYCQKDKWELALTAFQGFLEKYPRHQIGDAVSFRIADIYKFKLKDETKATGLYQNLINSYPNSSWAALAKQRLTQPNQGETQHEK